MTEYIVKFTKGTRVGARCHRNIYIWAETEAEAEKEARKTFPGYKAAGYRLSGIYALGGGR